MTKVFKCPICERSFNKGRALSCHKLVHTRRGRSNVLQIESTAEAASFRCPVCSKGFVSARSVCGHMKMHSDRNWRGMIPPTSSRSRHGKEPMNDDNNNNNSDPSQKSLVMIKRKKRQYNCTACARSFKSYQALGGHNSQHVRMGRVRSMEEGQNSGDHETMNQSGCFRFDLNKLPSEWTDQ